MLRPDPQQYVLVNAYSWPSEAYLAKSRLEEEGIVAIVTDEYLVSANWLYTQAIGGVKLFVNEQDVTAAFAALTEDQSAFLETELGPASNDLRVIQCPLCGASLPDCHSIVRELGIMGLILYQWPTSFSFLLGLPVLAVLALIKCTPCKHQRKR